jgi:MarR family 2-MHQ and catechol resistance regulon transcriptional repressor
MVRSESTSYGNGDEENVLHESVLRYLERFPWADVDAIETNLAITRTGLAIGHAVTRYLLPHGAGITRAQHNFLAILYLAEGKRQPLSEIAREMEVSPTYITKLLDGLEKEGLVERLANPADRRVTYAHLTPEGEALCTTLVPAFLQFVGDLGLALTQEEKSQLRSLLAKYAQRIETISPSD